MKANAIFHWNSLFYTTLVGWINVLFFFSSFFLFNLPSRNILNDRKFDSLTFFTVHFYTRFEGKFIQKISCNKKNTHTHTNIKSKSAATNAFTLLYLLCWTCHAIFVGIFSKCKHINIQHQTTTPIVFSKKFFFFDVLDLCIFVLFLSTYPFRWGVSRFQFVQLYSTFRYANVKLYSLEGVQSSAHSMCWFGCCRCCFCWFISISMCVEISFDWCVLFEFITTFNGFTACKWKCMCMCLT